MRIYILNTTRFYHEDFEEYPGAWFSCPVDFEEIRERLGVQSEEQIEIEDYASLLISMGENPLLIKERLGHEKIQTTLGTYGHLYPNTNVEVAKKLTGVLTYTPATTSVADYTSNQHTAIYHRAVE